MLVKAEVKELMPSFLSPKKDAAGQSRGGWRELLSASGTLTFGNLLAGLAGLGWLAIMTRTLDLSSVGIFASLLAMAGLAERIFAFGTWQAMIHFGSKETKAGQYGRLATLMKLGWILDTVTSVFASAIALLVMSLIPSSIIDFGADDRIKLVLLFPLVFGAHSSSMGFLRLHDRYQLQANATILGPTVSLGIFALLSSLGVDQLFPYAVGWAVGVASTRMSIIVAAFILRRRYRSDFEKAPTIWDYARTTPLLPRFLVTTHADGVIRAIRDFDVLAINFLIGTEGTGLYKVGRTVSSVFGRLTGPFHQAVLPIFSRLSNSGNWGETKGIARKSSGLLGTLMSVGWGAFALSGETLLPLVFGPGFEEAYLPTLLLLLSMVIWGFSQPLSPILVAEGRVRTLATIHAATATIYIFSLYLLTPMFGINGAAIALILFYVLWSSSTMTAVLLKSRRPTDHQVDLPND